MPEDHTATVTARTGMPAGLGAGLPTGIPTGSGERVVLWKVRGRSTCLGDVQWAVRSQPRGKRW